MAAHACGFSPSVPGDRKCLTGTSLQRSMRKTARLAQGVRSTRNAMEFPQMTEAARQTYPFTLPDLPYPHAALEPHIDEATMHLHHDKHHKTYVDKLNEALAKAPDLQKLTLIELLRGVDKLPDAVRTAVKNNGGQHFNHDLFWNSLSP